MPSSGVTLESIEFDMLKSGTSFTTHKSLLPIGIHIHSRSPKMDTQGT